MKTTVRLLALVLIALPIMGYALGVFYLTDTQGNQHAVTLQMSMVENGQLLPDGNYKTERGVIIKVQEGRIVSNGSFGVLPRSNSTMNQNGMLNSQPNNINQSTPVYPYPLPPPLPKQQPNTNIPMMSLPSINTPPIVSVPQNPNTPTMNQIAPTPPSQQAGAPGL